MIKGGSERGARKRQKYKYRKKERKTDTVPIFTQQEPSVCSAHEMFLFNWNIA